MKIANPAIMKATFIALPKVDDDIFGEKYPMAFKLKIDEIEEDVLRDNLYEK